MRVEQRVQHGLPREDITGTMALEKTLLPGRLGRLGRLGRRSRWRGQALVEFALVVPIFLLIAFGTIDFGLAFDASITISNASREGARLGVTNPNTTAIQNRVKAVAGRLNDSRLTISVSCKTAAGAACSGGMAGATTGTTLVVTVGYGYPMITPIAFGTIIPISSTAQMRVE